MVLGLSEPESRSPLLNSEGLWLGLMEGARDWSRRVWLVCETVLVLEQVLLSYLYLN